MIRSGAKLFAVVSALTFGVVGISNTAANASSKPPIVIGMTASLTGNNAAVSAYFLKGVQAWQHMINTGTGYYKGQPKGLLGRQVQLTYTDDASNSQTALSAYTSLMTQQNVNFVIPPYGSGESGVVAPLAAKYGYAMLMATASATSIFQQGNPNIVETEPQITQWGAYIPKFMGQEGYKTAALLTVNSPSALLLTPALQQGFTKYGATTVSNQVFQSGTTDFTAALQNIQAAHPDVIIVNAFGPDTVTIFNQMAALKIQSKAVFAVGGAYRNDVFVKGVGAATSDCTITDVQWSDKLGYPGVSALTSALGRAIINQNGGVDGSAAWGFETGQLLADAVTHLGKKALTLPQTDIVNWIKDHPGIKTVTGTVIVDKGTGLFAGGAHPLEQIQHGKRVVIFPTAIASGKPQLPCEPYGTAGR